MKTNDTMTPRNLGLLMWGILSMLTIVLYLIDSMPEYPKKALPLLWCFFSWNYYAYAFDKRMWPPQFVELHGSGKGVSSWRAFWFWAAVLQYVGLLGLVAWAG